MSNRRHDQRREARATRFTGIATVALLLGAALVGCSDDKPAVCSSVDNLKTSVDDVKNIDVTSSGAVSDLESGLTTIKSDLADVKTDAKSQYASQLDAVDSALAKLTTSVDAAKTDPSAATLAAVAAAAAPFNNAVQTLISDVQSTC
jgi:hypothetical protein